MKHPHTLKPPSGINGHAHKAFGLRFPALLRFCSIVVALATFGMAPARADDRAKTIQHLATAQHLLSEASAIVAATPTTAMGGAEMVNGSEGPAGRFYIEERRYQDAVVKPTGHRVSDDGVAAANNYLAEADSFLYASVQNAVASCNGASARASLRVARVLIAEAARDIAGHVNESFEEPRIGDDGPSQCR